MSKLAKALSGAAGNAAGDPLYVEDVFSTYLYDGTGAVKTITNGIDLDGEGGVVWIKQRSGTEKHVLAYDENKYLSSNTTDAVTTNVNYVQSFNSNGFQVGVASPVNTNGSTFASWTFRKAEKFFDVVTYTGNYTAGTTIAHNLGSAPKMMFIKNTSGTGGGNRDWIVYHASLGGTKFLSLNLTASETTRAAEFNNTDPTSSVFTLGGGFNTNQTGESYVAYLFASDAGGYGDDGTESIIKCGSYTGTGTAGLAVAVGFEPQFVMFKAAVGTTSNWTMLDSMRGIITGGEDRQLYANSSGGEGGGIGIELTANGFNVMDTSGAYNTNGATYIYMAIRRPMKTPTVGTEVFAIGQGDGDADIPDFISNFPVDAGIIKRITAGDNGRMSARLTGENYLSPNLDQAESGDNSATFDFMNGWGSDGTNKDSSDYSWMFKRATGFMDVVCYTGDGGGVRTISHNLGTAPGMLWLKRRDGSSPYGDWYVQTTGIAASQYLTLNSTGGKVTSPDAWDSTYAASNVFTVGPDNNQSTFQYIVYLWGTVDGVSKVGTYTGTGADLNVDCGFTGGARFILIKRTDSSGDWYVWDSLRGISAGNDPYLLLNTTAAQVTGTDYVDPLNAGFTVTSNASSTVNVNGGTYIFLAIA
jgi:hypothetical protein